MKLVIVILLVLTAFSAHARRFRVISLERAQFEALRIHEREGFHFNPTSKLFEFKIDENATFDKLRPHLEKMDDAMARDVVKRLAEAERLPTESARTAARERIQAEALVRFRYSDVFKTHDALVDEFGPRLAVDGSLGDTGRDQTQQKAAELYGELNKLRSDNEIPKDLRDSALGVVAVRLERIRQRILDKKELGPDARMSRLSSFYSASAKWVQSTREALKTLGKAEAEKYAERLRDRTRADEHDLLGLGGGTERPTAERTQGPEEREAAQTIRETALASLLGHLEKAENAANEGRSTPLDPVSAEGLKMLTEMAKDKEVLKVLKDLNQAYRESLKESNHDAEKAREKLREKIEDKDAWSFFCKLRFCEPRYLCK